MKKKACVFTGIGFGSQKELVALMRDSLGWEVLELEIDASSVREKIPEFLEEIDFFFLRAHWGATFEEALYAELLAERLKDIFQCIQKRIARGDHVKVLGIGRGAWVLLKANFESSDHLRSLPWVSAETTDDPWCAYKIFGNETQFLAEAHSSLIPRVDFQNQGDMKPWMVTNTGQVVGWEVSRYLFLAWADPLSYTAPVQLTDYGYLDYAHIQPATEFLLRFARRENLEL